MYDSQSYSLELVTPPAEEPCTLGELRSSLRLTTAQDDREIMSLHVPSARRLIEETIGVRLVTQTWRLNLDRFPLYTVQPSFDAPVIFSELPIGPTQSVTSIKYDDRDGAEQTLSTSVYSVDVKRPLARICLKYGQVFPVTSVAAMNTVRILFVCGYGLHQYVPANLRAAVMLQAKAMYEGENELTDTVKRLINLEWSGSLDAQT